ncbi:MAG: DUF2155 domain-containing protein [Paracoccaceae bacterium]
MPASLGVLALMLLSAAGPAAAQERTDAGTGAVLRVLDKTDGSVEDVTLARGGQARVEQLTIDLGECRYPSGAPSRNAFALLAVRFRDQPEPVFLGWMIGNAPALSAMEHPRYDVWVLRCTTS